MKAFIKQACIIFCVIFTVLILIHFLRGEILTSQVVESFAVISLFSAALSFLLKDNEKIRKQRVVIQQVIYLMLIMTAVVAISYFGGWEQSFWTVLINFMIVMGLYVLIKFLLFKEDKKEANEIRLSA